MSDGDILPTCVTQSVQKLPLGCFDVVNNKTEEKTHQVFKMDAEAVAEIHIDEAEDGFWSHVTEERVYSINTPMSLFGDETKLWNLDKFTKDESSIHTKPSHRFLKVSVF